MTVSYVVQADANPGSNVNHAVQAWQTADASTAWQTACGKQTEPCETLALAVLAPTCKACLRTAAVRAAMAAAAAAPSAVCECGGRHAVTAVHVSPTQGQIYATTCPYDGLTDYWTAEGVDGLPDAAVLSVRPGPSLADVNASGPAPVVVTGPPAAAPAAAPDAADAAPVVDGLAAPLRAMAPWSPLSLAAVLAGRPEDDRSPLAAVRTSAVPALGYVPTMAPLAPVAPRPVAAPCPADAAAVAAVLARPAVPAAPMSAAVQRADAAALAAVQTRPAHAVECECGCRFDAADAAPRPAEGTMPVAAAEWRVMSAFVRRAVNGNARRVNGNASASEYVRAGADATGIRVDADLVDDGPQYAALILARWRTDGLPDGMATVALEIADGDADAADAWETPDADATDRTRDDSAALRVRRMVLGSAARDGLRAVTLHKRQTAAARAEGQYRAGLASERADGAYAAATAALKAARAAAAGKAADAADVPDADALAAAYWDASVMRADAARTAALARQTARAAAADAAADAADAADAAAAAAAEMARRPTARRPERLKADRAAAAALKAGKAARVLLARCEADARYRQAVGAVDGVLSSALGTVPTYAVPAGRLSAPAAVRADRSGYVGAGVPDVFVSAALATDGRGRVRYPALAALVFAGGMVEPACRILYGSATGAGFVRLRDAAALEYAAMADLSPLALDPWSTLETGAMSIVR